MEEEMGKELLERGSGQRIPSRKRGKERLNWILFISRGGGIFCSFGGIFVYLCIFRVYS